MSYGTTYCYSEDLCRRLNSICLQKKQNYRSSWPWWTHTQYNYLHFRKKKNKNPLLENVPIPDSLERGVPPGRLTRREYKVRVVETRYPCSVRRDFAEFTKYSECSNENVCSKSPGSFLRNKPSTPRVSEVKADPSCTKSICSSNRRTLNESICRRVFQSVGSDLIAPWLTPKELCNSEKAFDCSWDWGQAWHRGKVRNKAVASTVEYILPTRGLDYLIEFYNRDDVFSALWHLLPIDNFKELAEKYRHVKSIRKLLYLAS